MYDPCNRVIFAAMTLSVGSEAAHIAFSDVVFSLGEMNDRHRKALLERLELWEQIVTEDAKETKRMFRHLVEEKLRAWSDRR